MDHPLHIAMVGQRGVPARWGGIERHVEEIGARLAARGHRVTVASRPGYTDDVGRSWRGMEVVQVPTVRTKHLDASVHSALATLAALRTAPDVVHFHALGPGVFTPLPRWCSSAAVVQTIHGFDDERAKWGPAARTLLRSARWLSERVPHAVIGVSEAIASTYGAQRRPGGPIVRHIGNGTDPPRHADTARLAHWDLRPGGYALFVGRLVPEKQVTLLLEAFRSVPGELRLVIAGDSSFSDDYVAEVRRLAALDPRILLTGYVFDDDLAALYAGAAVFVLPSRLEGLPLTLLEAISYGCPVIASDIDPHREVLGEAGPEVLGEAGPEVLGEAGPEVLGEADRVHRLVRMGDRQALTAALCDLALDVAVDPAGLRADATAQAPRLLAPYDWDRATSATEALYREVVERRAATVAPTARPTPRRRAAPAAAA